MIGRTIAQYRVVRELGRGGMGVVYLAEDDRLGRLVALKALPADAARDPVRRKRFEHEARAAAALSHPNIAAVYELEEAGDDLYIVFEYVEGESLRHLLGGQHVPFTVVIEIGTQIAQALAAAHGRGIVHRDLKPENVLRRPSGEIKVLDFGLAQFASAGSNFATQSVVLTTPGTVVGTVAYMSPEQLETKPVDFRSDIFSFGVMLYELTTGVHPFAGESPASIIAGILTAEPPSMIDRSPIAPPELDRIVRKCLRKNREERYQSTLDLGVDLAALKHDSGGRPGRVAAMAGPEEDDILLRKLFSRIEPSARRWWELNQLFLVFAYPPVVTLVTYLLWQVWESKLREIPSTNAWRIIWENVRFFHVIAVSSLLVATVAIRLYLLCLGAFVPSRLMTEVRTFRPVLKGAYLLLAALLAFVVAGLSWGWKATHPAMAATMAALSLATGAVALYIEPAIDRAAFPQAFAQTESHTQLRYIAAIQMCYVLLLIVPVTTGMFPLDGLMEGVRLHPSPAQLGGLAYSIVLFVGGSALLISAVRLLQEGVVAARSFRRWFPAYLAVDFVGVGAWIAMVLEGRTPAVIALALTVLLFVLPFVQLRLAKQVAQSATGRL